MVSKEPLFAHNACTVVCRVCVCFGSTVPLALSVPRLAPSHQTAVIIEKPANLHSFKFLTC
jgi:hypothetical protein